MDAQYELGEMFHHCLLCGVYMRFARNYIGRASKQGHFEAIARMKELRSCVLCGADDAPLACSLCRQASKILRLCVLREALVLGRWLWQGSVRPRGCRREAHGYLPSHARAKERRCYLKG